MRARQAGALVVLGSATPSLESYQNAQTGRYTLVTLERRVLDRPLADGPHRRHARASTRRHGPDVILSAPLRAGDRRIGSTAASRRSCCSTAAASRSVGLLPAVRRDARVPELQRVADRAPRRAPRPLPLLQLLDAAAQRPAATARGPYLEQIGFGTERVEAEVRAQFPAARVARVDRDTIRRRGAIAALLARFAAREIDILVGTQMIAKGHDFPRVTLVGVISADVGLGLADFRAAERTFQLLTQVAGRAGRGEIPGEAIVQTLFPTHYSIRARLPPGLRGVLPRGARVPAGDALSAGRRADQRDRQGRTHRRRDGATRASSSSALRVGSRTPPFACSVRRPRRSAA